MPTPVEPFGATSGTDGRVKLPSSHGNKVVAGVSSWRRSSKTTTIPLPHFESPANADGLVQPQKIRGLGDGGSVSIEGIVNLVAGSWVTTVLDNGVYVRLDLLVSKSASLGYAAVPGWIDDFQIGQKISNEAATFSATLDVDGPFPAFGTVPNP